jgi:hypothetical protein
MKIPKIVVFKGTGKDKSFKFDEESSPCGMVSVFHRRGGRDVAIPFTVFKRKVKFAKPPQKGNTVVVVYSYDK